MSCDASRYGKDASRVGWGATLNGKRSTKVIELTQSGLSSRASVFGSSMQGDPCASYWCLVEAKQLQVMTAT